MGTKQSVQIEYRGIGLEIECDITPAERGRRDSYGAPEQPDFATELVINKVFVGIHEGETEIDIIDLLGEDVLDDIKAKCWLVLNEPNI